MRTFIALEIPDGFRFEAAGLARQLSGLVKGRFIDPANYHVTLAFLGDADERTVEAAMDALDAVCSGRAPIPLASDGLGTFGKPHDATLWLGIRPQEALVNVAASVRDELDARGVAFDRKPFKPHVTLARRASLPRGTLPLLAFPEPALADAVSLFKSDLAPDGASYHSLARYPLMEPKGDSPLVHFT